MRNVVTELSYLGDWPRLFDYLTTHPDLVNAASSEKAYTPLHQAAWHGASPGVIGRLLSLGANPSLRTLAKSQTAQEIAAERFPKRSDLQFLLRSSRRTLAQLLRKFASTDRELFDSYDGNQVLFDRLLTCFSTGEDEQVCGDPERRLMSALRAIAGEGLFQSKEVTLGPENYRMQAELPFWTGRVIPAVVKLAERADVIALDSTFAVISDLFDPPPEQWGLRGDLFLWMETCQALCHVPVPEDDRAIERIILAAFTALTGDLATSTRHIGAKRFARGGMSSGMISTEFWTERFTPLIQQRAQWMRQAWAGQATRTD